MKTLSVQLLDYIKETKMENFVTKEMLLNKETNCLLYLDQKNCLETMTNMRNLFLNKNGWSCKQAAEIQNAILEIRGE